MGAALELLRKNKRTYRVAFSDLAAVSGVAIELIGVVNKHVTLRHIQISKPSAALTPLTVEKLSAVSTGGTSTTPTPVPTRASFSAAGGVVKLYTVAPTKGTLIDQIQEVDVGVSDVMNEHYGDPGGGGAFALEAAVEVIAIVVTATVTLNGYIEWQEEP